MRDRLKPLLRAVADRLTAPVGSILAVRTSEPRIALTFDDGPDPEVTPRLLDILNARDARATFFMLCTRARSNGSLVRRVLADGHEIALHGLDHRRLTRLPPAQAIAAIESGQRELEDLAGVRVRWFRPPYGSLSPRVWLGVSRAGLQSVLWGPSLWDWKPVTSQARLTRAMTGIGPGAVVLGHDGLAGSADLAEPAEVPQLDRAAWAGTMTDRYAAAGLASVTLSELLAGGRPVRGARFSR